MRRLRRNIGDINRGGRSFSGLTRFNPTALLGYVPSPYSIAELRGLGRLWQNTAKTTPAVADGDPVRVVDCGGGVDYTAPTDAARPLLWAEGGGRWSLSFDGVDDQLQASSTTLTLFASMRHLWSGGGVAFSNFSALFSATTVNFFRGDAGGPSWRSNGGLSDGVFGSTIRVNGVTTLTISPFNNTWHTSDGSRASGSAVSNVLGTDGTSPSGRFWNGRMAGLITLSSVPDSSILARISNYIGAL